MLGFPSVEFEYLLTGWRPAVLTDLSGYGLVRPLAPRLPARGDVGR